MKEVFGLYCHSGDSITSVKNRDINAAENMAQIIRCLIDFGEIPYEFREDVVLRGRPEYESRHYAYTEGKTNDHGQVIKFKRKKIDSSWHD